MDLLFDWEEERDRYSFEDSDRFEDDSFCSWVSEPESLCNNWRGWRKPTGLGNVSTGGNFGVPFFQTTFNSTLVASVNSSNSQPKTTADVPLLSLVELTAKAVARYIPFEVVEHFYPPIPEQLQLRIAFWSFPENEDDIRLYSCLANGSADEFVKGEFHYKTKCISDVLQIGFHLSGSVTPTQFNKGPYSVAVTFDRRHITSCTCTCNSTASWCSHVVALCLFRIHQYSNVCLRAPVSESLSRLGRDQLQKFAQYLISELPQHFLPTAQRLLDELLSSQCSDINTVCGAPDPTAGPSASEQTTWCLDETALHENIKKTLVKFCIPSPVVLSDVNYLSSNSPPAATEYQSLLRPLRGREPEGIWNLLLIIREMFKRNDSNSIPLLEILTEEILECDMILTWWYNNKTSASLHSNHQHPNNHHNFFSTNGGTRLPGGGQGGSSATQHAASSLCDELVALWRLASLNPSLTGSQQLDLSVQLRDYHSRALEKLHCRNRGQYLYSKEEMELFSGFKPAVEACLLDWGVFKPDDTSEGALRGSSVAFWIKSLLKIKSDGEAVKIVHAKTIHNKCNISADSSPSGGQGVLAENKPPLLPFQVSSFSSSTISLRGTAVPGTVSSNIFLNNLSTPFPFRGNNEGAAGGDDHLMDVDGLRGEKALQFAGQSYFADVRKMTNMQEIKFAVAEALYAHGHLAEASALARELALEMLASCQVSESNQQPKHSCSDSEKRKRTTNPAFQMLANASFLCTVLLENPENNLIAFKIGIYGLEMNRPPAPTKQLEVKLAYQESELASQLKKIPLTTEELNIIRDRAEKLKDGRIKSRGEAMLPVTLSMFIFESLCLNSGNKTPTSLTTSTSSTLPASTAAQASSKTAASLTSSIDEKLGFEAAVVALGLKANVSEAEHPLLCEGLRRQRGELAVSLLVYCKDDPAKLARVMNKILDREVHQLYKTPPPWYAYLAESSSVTLPSSSSTGVSLLLPSSSSSQASTTEVQSSPSGAQTPLMLSSSSASAKSFLKLNNGKVYPSLPLMTPSAVAPPQPSYSPSTFLPSTPSSASPLSSTSLVQSSVGLSLLASSASSPQSVVDLSTKKEINETRFTGLKTPSLSSESLTSTKDCKSDSIDGKAATFASSGHSDGQSCDKEMVVKKEIFEAAAEVALSYLEGGGATASGNQQIKKIVSSSMDVLDDNFTGDDDDAVGRSKYKEWETRFRCTNLKTTKKPSVGMASIDSSAPETTSSDNSPTLLRRASKQPPTSPPHHHHHHINNLCPDSDSGSSHESYDFNNSDSLQGCSAAPQRDADSPALSQLFESFYSPQPSSLAHHHLGVVNAKVTRYKGKNRVMPSIPNQPSEALAHFMFELAKTILIKAGGNISTSLFTQHSISFQNSSNNAAGNNNNSSSSNNNGNSNGGTNGPHRALHLCAFQIGLYALGLHNRVSPNWLSRTYSSLVSWIVGQATEIGPAAIKILTQSWERHLTPQEAASLADRASRCRDPSMVSAAAELALSCLSYAHSLNTNEIHIALNQCYDQSSEMLQRACLSVEMAAKEGTVHPEILFEVAKRWYELYTGPVSVAVPGNNAASVIQGDNRAQNANPSSESNAAHLLPVNQQMVSAANQREDMNVGLQVDSRLQVYPVAPYPMPQFTYQQAQQLYYHQPLLQQSQQPQAIHQQQHFLPPQPSQPPYLPAPSYSYLSIHHPHQQNGPVVALPPGSQSHPYFPQHSVIRHRGQQIMQVNLAPHVVPIQMPPPPAPYQIAFVGQAGGAGNPGGCHGNWQPTMFGYQHFQQFPVDPMQAPPPSVMVASLTSNNQVHHLQQIQQPLQQQPSQYAAPLSNSGVSTMPAHAGAGSQATSTIYFLYAAYRVGMLAMEALARKVHEDRPQIKYSRNPPYGEDVKWLLEVAIKLGMTHIQQFCASACTAILSPFILYDIAIDTAKAFSSGNMNQVNQNLRLPIVQSLLQKSSQMFVQCTHSRIHHIVAQDYDEFINILYSARKVFVLIPDGLTQFNELINGLKRTKSCKKDLWQKIFGLLS